MGNDQNGDGLEDYQITYPNGDQQTLYYQGIIEEPPPEEEECKTLQAPAIDPTVVSIPALVTQFIYTGANPIQTGVAADTIDLKRSATLRGSVTSVEGEPLFNAHITIKDHPEYGQTVSTCDGSFTMVVNGGATLTVNYYKDGYLPIQRQLKPEWQQYAWLEDVAMTALDPQVTTIDLNANVPIQVAQGSRVTDEDGSRQAVVLFPQGLTATMTLPDGSTQPLTALAVRATEYTVGENGPQAMPAPLPPASAYTYAVELSVDQAIAAGATRVDFSQPVPLYVDNFLNFPVGGIAPVGWYDYTSATWIASDNGRVIQIININNGLANIDLEGNGQAASASLLSELGITIAERQQLSHLYTPGKTLWRVPIPHFSPWDINWPVSPPPDAQRPNPPEPKTLDDDIPDKRCEQAGCIIEAESQVLGERLPIIGTPLSLNYRSHRVVGRKTAYTLNIPLQGDSVPKSLKEIRLRISVASQRFESRFSPTTRQTLFVWDGIDGYGRPVQGTQEARIEITYVYPTRYGLPSEERRSFARAGQMIPLGVRGRVDFVISKTFTKELGVWTPAGVGLGYLSLNIHHTYDPLNKILYQGSGGQRSAPASINGIIETVAGNGRAGFSGDGKLATEARLDYPHDTVVGPDGSLYIVDMMKGRVRRVGTDNIITTVAGNGKDKSSDTVAGREATEISLPRLYSIAIGPDGLLYIADRVRYRVLRVGSDGIISKVAGKVIVSGSVLYNIDGVLALETWVEPRKIAFGPEGHLYILGNNRVRRVDENGIITTIAGGGGGNWREVGDGGPATQAYLNNPWDMTFCPDGNLYIADTGTHRIRLVDLQGMITTVAGNGEYGTSGDGGPALDAKVESPMAIACGSDGIYFVERWGKQIRRIGWDGIINTVIGDPYRSGTGDGSPAREASLEGVAGIRFGPDGSLYIADAYDHRVRRVKPSFPGFSLDNIILPSEDGGQLYEFSPYGRHLRTFDSITSQMVYQFAYNDNGYLSQITDLDGDITRIERNGNTPVAIIAPDGQRTALTLDDKGYLNSVTNPASEAYQLQYTADGLLTAFIDPRGHKSVYQYDDLGRFVEDTNAAGGGWTLARSENLGGGYT